MVGNIFGRLTVIGLAGRDHGHSVWKCSCTCGNEIDVVRGSLIRGATRSCGCMLSEVSRARMTTHGRSKSREYTAWGNMMNRCYNTKNKKFKYYGGRGIAVCKRWHTPIYFLEDMGAQPSPRHTLERKNTNGNYCKSNCVWATWTDQQNNKRSNLILEHNGRKQSASKWEKELGLPEHILSKRITRSGWSHKKALSTPVKYER